MGRFNTDEGGECFSMQAEPLQYGGEMFGIELRKYRGIPELFYARPAVNLCRCRRLAARLQGLRRAGLPRGRGDRGGE